MWEAPLRMLEEETGKNATLVNFFDDAVHAVCDDKSHVHCLVNSFGMAPVLALMVLMSPFLFARVGATGEHTAGVRRQSRWLTWVQGVVSVGLALVPVLEVVLLAAGKVKGEALSLGMYLYAAFGFVAFAINAVALFQRSAAASGHGTTLTLPDYLLSWWSLLFCMEVIAVVVSLHRVTHEDRGSPPAIALDMLSLVSAVLLAVLAGPGVFVLWHLDVLCCDQRFTCGERVRRFCWHWSCTTRPHVHRADKDEGGPAEGLLAAPTVGTYGTGMDNGITDEEVDAASSFPGEGSAWDADRSPEERAGLCSRLSYFWMTPLMVLGWSRPLEHADLPVLSRVDRSKVISTRFDEEWEYLKRQASRAQRKQRRPAPSSGAHASYQALGGSEGRSPSENGPTGGPEQTAAAEDTAEHPSVAWAMARAYGGAFYTAAIFKFVYDLLQFVGPNLLNAIIKYLEAYASGAKGTSAGIGFSYVGVLVATSVIQTFVLHQYFLRVFRVGQNLRSAVVLSIYRKALRLSVSARQSRSIGEIVNIMSTDAQRMQDLTTYLQMMWSAPLQIVVSLVFLYQQIGAAVFAGLGVMVLFIPVNLYLASVLKRLQESLMQVKDKRVNATNEAISGIKLIKMSAWEDDFADRIRQIRNRELVRLRIYKIFNGFTGVMWRGLPLLVSLASFATYTWMGEQLTAAKAFTALALFNILQFPMSMLPRVINNCVEASVSIQRIQSFLSEREIDPSAVQRLPAVPVPIGRSGGDDAPPSVVVRDGNFAWPAWSNRSEQDAYDEKEDVAVAESDKHIPLSSGDDEESGEGARASSNLGRLEDISLQVPTGSLSCVVGPVGSGKSNLLQAMLGEMDKISGHIEIHGEIAFVSQSAFILNATLKDNVVFGRPYDPARYEYVVDVCQLQSDIDILPAGDATEIGERGINLSGGQRQRVSLARAVYANADVYLLDDALSAVDPHVGTAIFERAITGALRGKTRILVTHGVQYLRAADQVIVLQHGRIAETGSFTELVRRPDSALGDVVREYEASAGDAISAAQEQARQTAEEHEEEEEEGEEKEGTSHGGSPLSSPRRRLSSNETSEGAEHGGPREREELAVGKQTQEEGMVRGRVALAVAKSYIHALGGFSVMAGFLFLFALVQSGQVLSNWWLSYWSDHAGDAGADSSKSATVQNNVFYLEVYAGISFGSIFVLAILRVLLALSGVRAARDLHEGLLTHILRAYQSFFDTVPLGRILNRFSQDTYVIDEQLLDNITMLLLIFFSMAGTVAVISSVTPYFLLALLPIGAFYVFTQRYYVATSRELKRLDSVSRSPIYAHFSETLAGAVTIRAFGDQTRFALLNEEKLDRNQQAYFMSTSANRWLAVRLEMAGTAVVLGASVLAILGRGTISPSLAGLSISYSLSVTQLMNWAVRLISQVETQMVSVERVEEYSHVETEPDGGTVSPPEDWPSDGAITMRDLKLRYRRETPFVLHGISCEIRAREKIGICGRTGAGKSSLISALFRLADVQEGSLKIDGVEIADIPLATLRSRIAIIPQESTLFSGPLRRNLDPLGTHSDAALWNALEHVSMKSFVEQLEGGLNAEVSDGGENFSQGQQQLLCVARAVLRQAKIVLLDEATASVDVQTDSLLQRTIRREFADATVLTIAHRVHTILDSDRVMVLSNGRIVEFDEPRRLLADRNSVFASLMQESGAGEEEVEVNDAT